MTPEEWSSLDSPLWRAIRAWCDAPPGELAVRAANKIDAAIRQIYTDGRASRKEWKHDRNCLYVTSDGPAPCTCPAGDL